jgi:hypothetical protein
VLLRVFLRCREHRLDKRDEHLSSPLVFLKLLFVSDGLNDLILGGWMIRRPMSLQSAQRFEFNEFFSGPQVRPWASDESAQESFCPQPVAPGMPRRLGGLVCWVGCNAKDKRFHEVSNPLVNHLRLLDNVRHVTCRILLWRSLVRLTMQCVAGSCGSCSLPLGHPQGTAGSHGWTRVEDTSSFRPYRTSKVMPGLAGAEHVTEIYKNHIMKFVIIEEWV